MFSVRAAISRLQQAMSFVRPARRRRGILVAPQLIREIVVKDILVLMMVLLVLRALSAGTRQVLVMARARCATAMGAMAIAEPAIPVLERVMQGIIWAL